MKQLLKLYENYKDVLLQTPTCILISVSKIYQNTKYMPNSYP